MQANKLEPVLKVQRSGELTIFKRLTIGYVTIMLMVLFMGYYSAVKLNQINRIFLNINQVEELTIELAERISNSMLSQISFGKKFLIGGDSDFYNQFKEMEGQIKTDVQKLSGLIKTAEKRKFFNAMENLYFHFITRFEKTIELPIKSEGSLQQMEESWDNTADELTAKLRRLVLISSSDKGNQLRLSARISDQLLNVTGITAVFIILVGIVISFINTRSINRPVRTLQQKTKEIARGKFKEISNIVSPPEIKELADHFNNMCRRLKELEEMKIDFITHISHELRTPLTAIKEASSMLLEKVYEHSPKKQHELLVITQQECERLINSVNRILDLARMEARMMTFNVRKCRVETLIQKSIIKINPIALKKNIRIALKQSTNLPPVYIDEARTEQVFENLLGNALKFASRNDSITIGAAIHKEQDNFVQISIADTGPGIPTADIEKIFDKFHRIENHIETARGTGLGLSIAKHIISSHGGKIWVESREGEGSTFYFTLPLFSTQRN